MQVVITWELQVEDFIQDFIAGVCCFLPIRRCLCTWKRACVLIFPHAEESESLGELSNCFPVNAMSVGQGEGLHGGEF